MNDKLETAAALPPDAHLTQLIFGKWVSMAVSVAARLRIADTLADGPHSVLQLSEITGTHARSLGRLMRALASVGVFKTDSEGRYMLTEVGHYLRTGVQGSMRGVADYCGSDWSWRAWEELHYSVQTGQTAFDKVFGQQVFQYLAQHPDQSAVFNEGMTGFSGAESAAVVSAYDFSRFKRLIDIGGGHGHLLASILESAPGLRGAVFDAAHVVAGAHEMLDGFGLLDRAEILSGDFFAEVPRGFDAVIMKHIIHDWNDVDAGRILNTIRRAADAGTTLLIVEMVIPPGDEPHPGKLLDLEMLVVASGQERTESEYAQLLAQHGFQLQQIVPTRTPASIVEARAV